MNDKQKVIWVEWDNKKFTPSKYERHLSKHMIDIHFCRICAYVIKHPELGRKHIRNVHPYEYGMTKDFKELLQKQDLGFFDPSLSV